MAEKAIERYAFTIPGDDGPTWFVRYDAELVRDAMRYRDLERRIQYGDAGDGCTWAHLEWCVEVSSLAPPTLGAAIDTAIAQADGCEK